MESTVLAWSDGQLCVVHGCDGVDDAETETQAALLGVNAGPLEALEWSKEARDLIGGDDGTGVRDREDGAPDSRAGCDGDATAWVVVADRVAEDVADEPFEQIRIAVGGRRLEPGLDCDLVVVEFVEDVLCEG